MAKMKTVKKDKLLKEAKTMTIQQLADKYGVSYQTMHSYLKEAGFKSEIKGRPKSLKIEE